MFERIKVSSGGRKKSPGENEWGLSESYTDFCYDTLFDKRQKRTRLQSCVSGVAYQKKEAGKLWMLLARDLGRLWVLKHRKGSSVGLVF